MPAGGSALARIFCIRANRLNLKCSPLGWSLLLVLALAGCDQTADIVVERVPKDDTLAVPPVADEPAAEEQRMLAAMVLGDEKAVFFKVMGPPEALEQHRVPFLSLVSSYKPGDPPTWTVPEGWTETPGQGERLATIAIPTEPPLELSVTSLPVKMEDTDAYRLMNVNRWRGQLGLAPIEQAELQGEPESDADDVFEFQTNGEAVATVVDIEGVSTDGGMGGPFASMGSGGGGGITTSGSPLFESRGPDEPDGAEDTIQFDTPEGWTESAGNAFSQVALSVDDARVTVSGLSASANDLLTNINRWRGQVQLEPLEEADLKEQVQTITLGDGQDGHYVVLAGSGGQSILGVIATRGETMWFIKMTGGEETVASEKPKFEEFVKSLKFE